MTCGSADRARLDTESADEMCLLCSLPHPPAPCLISPLSSPLPLPLSLHLPPRVRRRSLRSPRIWVCPVMLHSCALYRPRPLSCSVALHCIQPYQLGQAFQNGQRVPSEEPERPRPSSAPVEGELKFHGTLPPILDLLLYRYLYLYLLCGCCRKSHATLPVPLDRDTVQPRADVAGHSRFPPCMPLPPVCYQKNSSPEPDPPSHCVLSW